MERNIEIWAFKGHIYVIVAIAYDADNYNEDNPLESRMVVYQNVESKQEWVRPYDDFISDGINKRDSASAYDVVITVNKKNRSSGNYKKVAEYTGALSN